MPILLTSDRDGIAVTGPDALSLLAARCAVVDHGDGDATDPHHHQSTEKTMPRKLPWPMSRIERDVLHELWLEAKRTGQPITAIVQEAVNTHLNRRLDAGSTPATPARVPAGDPAAAA